MEGSISSLPRIPDDIIISEILHRLPVKSLVRFSCVCKFWRKLITADRGFILSQLQNSVSNLSGYENVLLCSSGRPPNCTCQENRDLLPMILTQILVHDSESSAATRLIFREAEFKISGCCDGIICFVTACKTSLTVCLCNPALRQWRALPPSNYQDIGGSDNTFVCFYFDQASDDYKVVRIINVDPELVFEIYSLSNDSWKPSSSKILPPSTQLIHKGPVIHNGFPYWFALCVKDWSHVLNVLDMVQEKIREIPVPDGLIYPQIQVFQGSLSVFGWSCPGENVVWVMKEDRFGISWIKQLVFPDRFFYPLANITTGVTEWGKYLVASYEGSLFYYDPKNQQVEDQTAVVSKCVAYSEYVVADYVASLVSVIPPIEEKVPQGPLVEEKRRMKTTLVVSYSSRSSSLSRMFNCFVGMRVVKET